MGRLVPAWRCIAVVAAVSGGAAVPLPVSAQPDGGAAAVSDTETTVTRASVLEAGREQALQTVLDASRSDDARERAAALEAIQPVPERALPMAQLALEDENPGVRFAALVTIGELRLQGLGPAAMALAADENLSVRGAAVFAAHRCGEDVGAELSLLARMLQNRDLAVRGNAAMLLGMLGDEGAIPMLYEMAGLPMPRVSPDERVWLHMQFAEAILRLDPDHGEMLEVVRSSVFSNLDDVRALAIRTVGEVGDRAMAGGLEGMLDTNEPVQLRVAAARTLAQLGIPAGRRALMRGAAFSADDVRREAELFLRRDPNNNTREAAMMRQLRQDPEACRVVAADIRAQAAFGLGELDADTEAAQALAALLDDPHPVVRLAASASLLSALAEE